MIENIEDCNDLNRFLIAQNKIMYKEIMKLRGEICVLKREKE